MTIKTLALVVNGVVLSHFTTDLLPSDFPDLASQLIEAPANVQDGWEYDGTFHAHVPTADETRLASLDGAISSDNTLAQIKAMSSAEFDAWYSTNVTTGTTAVQLANLQAFVKRLARIVIRRVL